MRKLSLVSLALALATGCSHSAQKASELPAQPSDPRLETLVIVGTNDMHGTLAPQKVKTREPEGVAPISFERGGAAILAEHLKVLREEHPGRVLLLDAGDCFQGSLESNIQEGAPMVQLLNHLGVQASAVGNHEFDFGPEGPEGTQGDPVGALKARMRESRYDWLAANIIEKSSRKAPVWPNTSTSRLYTLGRLKVGVIGLSTIDTPNTTRSINVEHLEFTPLQEAALRESKALRAQGAQIVVIDAHAGLKCSREGEKPYAMLKPSDPQGSCDPKDEVVQLLGALPKGTVDAVVSGHTHTVVHHWVNGVPVIQSGTRNVNLAAIYLTYDLQKGRLITDRTRIEAPIPLCPKVFSNQNDCDGDKPAPAGGRGSLVAPTFHGREIRPDSATEAVLQPVFDRVAETKRRRVGEVARTVENPREQESAMGNLVSDAIREKVGADFAFVNPGGLRAPFEQGTLLYESVFRTLPFDNSISLLQVTGKELKLLLRTAENGSKGYFPFSGLKLTVLDLRSPAKADDLNGDGKKELWEVNRLIEVRTASGEPIEDKKTYKVATVDFLVQGGDDMGWAMKQIPRERITLDAGGTLRDTTEAYIAKLGVINTAERPLVDPLKPRLMILKEYPKTPKSRGGGRRRKK